MPKTRGLSTEKGTFILKSISYVYVYVVYTHICFSVIFASENFGAIGYLLHGRVGSDPLEVPLWRPSPAPVDKTKDELEKAY